jgi:hypothetical protein
LVNSAETVYGFVYVFWLKGGGGGGILYKDFPFSPLVYPPLLYLFLMASFSLSPPLPPRSSRKRVWTMEKEILLSCDLREREINHTFYIFFE